MRSCRFASILLTALAGCGAVGGPGSSVTGCVGVPDAPAVAGAAAVTLVALGDIGASEEGRNAEVAEALAAYVRTHPRPEAVLLLGDNFYPNGLIGADTWCWPWRRVPPDEAVAAQLAEVVGPFDFLRGLTVVHALPGNHDHGCPEMGSLENQAAIDRWLPAARAWGESWRLASGLPAVVVHSPLADVIALDTQAMLDDPAVLEAAAAELERLLAASAVPWRVVAGHHPLYANGFHDGAWWEGAVLKATYYPSHLLILPPLWYGRQNNYEWAYRRYRRRLEGVFARQPVDVFLAGHEHALELLRPAGPGQPLTLISGSGVHCVEIMERPNTIFATSKNGFAVVSLSAEAMELAFFATTPCDASVACGQPTKRGDWFPLFRYRVDKRGDAPPSSSVESRPEVRSVSTVRSAMAGDAPVPQAVPPFGDCRGESPCIGTDIARSAGRG